MKAGEYTKLLFILILAVIISGCGADGVDSEMKIFDVLPDDDNAIALRIIGRDGSLILEAWAEYHTDTSAADLTEQICRAKKIPFVTSGMGSLRYVKGIDNIFEFDDGPESGWVYTVGGEVMGISSGIYTVQPGDAVIWRYTLTAGEELE